MEQAAALPHATRRLRPSFHPRSLPAARRRAAALLARMARILPRVSQSSARVDESIRPRCSGLPRCLPEHPRLCLLAHAAWRANGRVARGGAVRCAHGATRLSTLRGTGRRLGRTYNQPDVHDRRGALSRSAHQHGADCAAHFPLSHAQSFLCAVDHAQHAAGFRCADAALRTGGGGDGRGTDSMAVGSNGQRSMPTAQRAKFDACEVCFATA
jgi:hypothetical protein